MSSIVIELQEKSEKNWLFQVVVSDNESTEKFQVVVEKEYWKNLTNKSIVPEKLIEYSFRFLLKREPKESILKKFNLKQITTYFPEYEKEIARSIS